VLGDWELNQNAVDGGIVVEAGDLFDKFCFRNGIGVVEEFAVDTSL
jgi:hypothetical protein